jgi:hypothetical protein
MGYKNGVAMFTVTKSVKVFAGMLAGGILAGSAILGCNSGGGASPSAQSSSAAPQSSGFTLFGQPPEKSGVELWSENCSRCHNMRPPNEFSAAQWGTIVHHMRLRANLTGDEERKITTFLQASS